jgi:xylulokinase
MNGLLGVDLGTSSVKALVVDAQGQVLGSGSAEYPILHPRPGYAEQEPEVWWRATGAAVRQALLHAGESCRIDAIGLSGQMHGTVLLDKNQRLVMAAVIWPDQRSARQVEEITQHIGAERLIDLTGSPVATGFQAATLAWLRQERADLWARIRHILLPKDYLRWRMTGEMATDPSDAAGALLLNVRGRTWAQPLLDLLSIEPLWLPTVQPSATVAGELTAAGAEMLGLRAGLPVVTGAADTACSMLGAGVVQPGQLLLTLSTGGQLAAPAASPTVDLRGRIHTFCSALAPGSALEPAPDWAGWYQMGAILAAGLALRWLRDQVFGWQEADAYERMMALAAQVPAGAQGLLFLPYLVGERTPHMNPHARAQWSGLTLQHGQAELIRAVVEGVTLACYDAYAVLAEVGAQAERIVLAGGGARSPLWRQIVADVFGAPVQPLASADQSALGAALLAGAGVGRFDLVAAAHSWARYDADVQPDPRRHSIYQGLLAEFRAAYRRNA